MPFQYKVSEDKKVRVIIDTDAACEADDPFAIAHALMCQKEMVEVSASILNMDNENAIKNLYELETALIDYFHIDEIGRAHV